VAAARRALQQRQKRLDPRKVVFIDETSVSTTITRLYGRAPQGERLVQKILHGNWKTVTSIAALRHDRVTAPFVPEGAMNGEMFKAYVEQFLAPTLKKNDIVFMDNASVHMVEGVEEAIEARGAILFYLPAYSPDFNPIEQLFAKLKSMLRKIAAYSLKQTAYTVDSLCAAIASSLTEITRSECAAYLANSGYGQSYRDNALDDRAVMTSVTTTIEGNILIAIQFGPRATPLTAAWAFALSGNTISNATRGHSALIDPPPAV
jgi:transposase